MFSMRASSKGLIVAVAIASAMSVSAPFAQSSRQIKFIVPFPAGGGGDVLTRMVAEKWGQTRGIATVIENRPGAATVLGVEAASRAAPDGNTLGTVANSFIIHPNFKKLSYDPLTSFEPVCLLASSPQVIVVNSTSPYKTLTEWLDAARAKPGDLSHASVGPASPQHIAFEQLKLLAKVNITFVPFNGNTPALNALLGGHVGSVMSNYSEAAELVNSGKLRALAVASSTRVEGWPNVPTVAEQGFKGYGVEAWYGLVAPAKTPKDKVAELSKWCAEAMLAPELKTKWDLQGLTPVGSTSEEFAAHLHQQSDDYASIIREASIKSE
jgi:tripartite-type tricarboxylate transporter receptor subunit TctC